MQRVTTFTGVAQQFPAFSWLAMWAGFPALLRKVYEYRLISLVLPCALHWAIRAGRHNLGFFLLSVRRCQVVSPQSPAWMSLTSARHGWLSIGSFVKFSSAAVYTC